LTIADGAVTEAKCNSTINASLDLADSSIQPGNAALTDERVPTAAGLTSKFGTSKATIVDGDKIAILDSAAADAPKHSLFSLVKSTLKTYFDTLYAATLGADDNYVTDAEKIVIGNTSGTNTGDQNLSGYVLTTAIDTLAELNGIITDATLIDTNDARLSDARTPTAHSHEGTAILSTGETGGTKFLREDGDGTSSWQTPPLQAALPAGLVSPYAGTTAPSGWLLCAGQTVSRTTYADLFAAVSTTYGAGDGSTTFALPDLRGRVPAGKDNMGGTDAARLTNALTGGVDGDTLGAVGGDDGHQLTVAQLAAHGHTINTRLRTSSLTANDTNRAELGDTSNSTSTSASMAASTGGNAEHNNVQPTIILNYIIKT
jgi:microcystin-dependent protein